MKMNRIKYFGAATAARADGEAARWLLGMTAAVILVFGLAGTAQAAATINSVTLDGGTAWTSGGVFADGDSVTVGPGDSIPVAINVTAGSGNNDWDSTGWDVDGTSDCEDHTNHANVTTTENFNITAPAVPGTYDLTLTASNNNNCTGQTAVVTLVDAVIVTEAVSPASKNFLDGPLDGTGASLDPLDSTPLVVTGNDVGGIWVGLDQSQHYIYEIVIENTTGSAIDLMVNDVVPADFDMDLNGEDIADSTDDGACTDGTCDGAASDNTACTFALTEPPSGDGVGGSKEPEFIDITVDNLADEDSCTITVYVMTVLNPGGGNTLYEPTSCRVKVQTPAADQVTSEDVIETFSLNEGVRVYDPTTSPPERLFGPEGSLQLTCNPAP